MKYTEKLCVSETENSSLGQIFYRIIIYVISPFRLCGEVAKKMLLLGDLISDILIRAVVINVILFLLSALNSLTLSHRFEIFSGFLPFTALGVSLVIVASLTLLSFKLPRLVNLDNLDKQAKERSVENIEKIHEEDSKKVDLSKSKKSKVVDIDLYSDDEDSIMDDDDFISKLQKTSKSVDDLEIQTHLNNPDVSTDKIYHAKKENSTADMIEELQAKMFGSNLDNETLAEKFTKGMKITTNLDSDRMKGLQDFMNSDSYKERAKMAEELDRDNSSLDDLFEHNKNQADRNNI